MRIFSADNLDVVPLLSELTKADAVRQFSFDGKPHGAVRNFCKYQKPKTPKFRGVSDDDIRNYVSSKYPKPETSGVKLDQFPQNGEIPPQREEGGDSLSLGVGNGEGAKTRPPTKAGYVSEESKLTIDFVPSDVSRETIRGMGFGDAQFNGEFSKFMAYYAARVARRADWNAALVSWFQRAKPDGSAAVNLALVGKVLIIEGTLEERCWQQDTREKTGRAMPIIDVKTDNDRLVRGWYKPTLFPPGYDEATGEKLPPKSDEAAA
jgi:hypothetical protein